MPTLEPIELNLPEWSSILSEQHARFKAIYGGRGSGKALRSDTPISTPTGWTPINGLRPGDKVFDENGNLATCLSVHEQGYRNEYKITFSDKTSIVAGADHSWAVLSRYDMRTQFASSRDMTDWALRSRVMSTVQIMKHMQSAPSSTHSIPTTDGLHCEEADLPIDPYLLGLWLGDGDSARGRITGHKDDMPHYGRKATAAGETWHEYKTKQSTVHKGALHYSTSGINFTDRLSSLNVRNNKHIPLMYGRASHLQRIKLLQGLMDADGHAQNTSVCFTNVNKRLAEDVLELTRTLGELPRLYSDTTAREQTRYRIIWRPSKVTPFSLPRKCAKLVPLSQGRGSTLRRQIVSIKRVGRSPMTCITVDSPSNLFLAGKGMIPTHNTWTVAAILVMDAAARTMRIACVREIQKSIQQSAKQVIVDWIRRLGLQSRFEIQRDRILCDNGSEIFFAGMNGATEDQVKGWEQIDRVWFEEAQKMSESSRDILYPTIFRKAGAEILAHIQPRTPR